MNLRLHRIRRAVALTVASAAVVLLSGCGFHLAGNEPLPPQLRTVYIEMVDPYHVTEPPLQAALIQRIQRGGGKLVSGVQQAGAVLRLSDLTLNREVVAIGPDGRALEYRLITSVSYELAVDGKIAIPPETQTVSSDYSFNAQQILAKEEEEVRLEKYIQDELAELILLRIKAELTHGVSPSAPAASTPPA